MQITGIILAGGKSKRMGTDKALLKLDGNTLLDDVVVGREWRLWTLGSYFVRKTNFHDGLLDLIFGR